VKYIKQMEGHMATRIVKLTGIAEWAKVFEDNRDMQGYDGVYESCNGACTIDVILDEDNLMKLKASRSIKKGKPDPEGRGHTVRFVRKFDGGQPRNSGAPVVLKSDGTVWDYNEDGTIGNGSTVEVTLSVYDTRMANIVGTRLDKVKVIDYVEYVQDTGDSPPPVTESKTMAKDEVLF
tara:strand:+ start:4289 stop:4822 length:534 start_codon:yes stop_codon:yes gene_type:complete